MSFSDSDKLCMVILPPDSYEEIVCRTAAVFLLIPTDKILIFNTNSPKSRPVVYVHPR